MKKICLICNGGGHFVQLRLATKKIIEGNNNVYWITDPSKHIEKELKDYRHYVIANPNTKKMNWAINGFQTLYYLIKERPDMIFSTGAGVAYPTMLFGKYIFGCKIFFICSAANVTKPSKIPYMVYNMCDEFFVQWPEMQKIFPKAKYIGVL